MKKKIITASIYLLCCMLLLPSCNSKDEILPKTKEEDVWWGYFEGTINGNKISLKNKEYPYLPIRSLKLGSYPYEGSPSVDSVQFNRIETVIAYNENATLSVLLYELAPSVRNLTFSEYRNWNDTRLWLNYYNKESGGEKTVKSRYVVRKSNPFRVEITDVTWLSIFEPILEVKLDGVLYNENASKDSIIIKATYGTR